MKVLLIDDEKDFITNLQGFIAKLGYETVVAYDGNEGLNAFYREKPDVIITDIRMPGMDGIEFIRRVKSIAASEVDIIIITGFSNAENTIRALKYGVRDFFTKPPDIRELASLLMHCDDDLRQRNKQATRRADAGGGSAAASPDKDAVLLGEMPALHVFSESMRALLEKATLYAQDPALPILIRGETGTGKELIAQFIARRHGLNKPFIAINCAALPEQLIEAELFGYEKGAFTGASPSGYKGVFERARDGTVFLDEIGTMDLHLQSKLLRVLEQKVFMRVGGTAVHHLSSRVLAATNSNLEDAVADGEFRSDLLYRINAGMIEIPALRDRREEIVPLAYEFGRLFAREQDTVFSGISPQGEALLEQYPWPGNVRELKNSMRLLTLVARGRVAGSEDIKSLSASLGTFFQQGVPEEAGPGNGGRTDEDLALPPRGFNLEQFNLRVIKSALAMHGGNISKTALYLGLTRRQLQHKVKKNMLKDDGAERA